MIDDLTKNKILDAANIVDVVSDFVTLKRAGANYKGLCPFHDDRTPSFMVSPAKNLCKCFACGKGGTPVGFIMEHEQLSYPDALRWLAKKYGITIKERELTPEERASQTERESMFIVNEWANKWFQKQMYETADGKAIGLAYFRGRGFRDDIIRKFQLGYCPSGREKCTKAALAAGYQEKFLISSLDDNGIAHGVGISTKHDDGKILDRFSGRVMFPIFNVSGKVVGFGGRVLDSATKGVNVKYQNSPESIIYHKKNELYGLFQAKQAIIKQECCFMVEGYTDVLAMHQNGVENVVASSGTALTREQIRLLHRFTTNIVILYDSDAAGVKASLRGIDMLLREGMSVRLMLLPDGKDPDEFGREHTAEEFQRYIQENQVDFIKFKANLLLKEAKGDPILLSRLVSNIVQSIAVIPDEITRTFYIRETAQLMQIGESLIADAVKKQINKNIEEWRKEKEREEKRRSNPAPANPAEPVKQQPGVVVMPYPTDEEFPSMEDIPPVLPSGASPSPAGLHQRPTQPAQPLPPTPRKRNIQDEKEKLIIQLVMRHGEEIICLINDEQGTEHSLSLTEYVLASLEQDQLKMQNELYGQILQEALQHNQDEGFKASQYFLNHPEQSIRNLAFELITDKEELSSFYNQEKKQEDDRLRLLMDQTTHLLIDMKLSLVQARLDEIQNQMRLQQASMGQNMRELMKEFQQIKAIQNSLAKACGDRVIMHK